MISPRLRYATLGALSIYWLTVVTSILYTVNGGGLIIFPRPPIPQSELARLLFSTVLLLIALFAQALNEFRKDSSESVKISRILPLVIFILISFPIVVGYVFETDVQSIGQMILDVGTALIEETFEAIPPGEDPPNWDEQSGDWAAYDDGGNIVYYQGDNSDQETLTISTSGDTNWVDYTIDVDLKFINGINRNTRAATIVFRYQGGNNHYILVLREYTNLLQLYRHGGLGGGNLVGSVSCDMDTGVWYHVTLSISEDFVNASVDGVPYFVDTAMNGAYHFGSVGIGTIYYGVMFDNILVEPID